MCVCALCDKSIDILYRFPYLVTENSFGMKVYVGCYYLELETV